MLLALGLASASAALAGETVLDFPCARNLVDGRFLVDGPAWERRMRELGHDFQDDAFVPFEVTSFALRKVHDRIWADGLCRMKLRPVDQSRDQ